MTPTPQDVKGSKILKLPSVRNCLTIEMTNKLAVIINSLKVPKIEQILLYEMKFLEANYSCMFQPSSGLLQADVWNMLGSFYLRTNDVDDVPKREGHLGSLLGMWGSSWHSCKIVVDSFRLDSVPEAEGRVIPCFRKVAVNLGYGRVQLNCDGTQWRTGGEVKGKLTNGVGSQWDLVVSIQYVTVYHHISTRLHRSLSA